MNTTETGISRNLFSRTQVAQQLREKMDKWDYMKLESFCTAKEMASKLKRPPTEWEKNLCYLYIRQRTYNQNIQGAKKT
jgi:hypothetical protein